MMLNTFIDKYKVLKHVVGPLILTAFIFLLAFQSVPYFKHQAHKAEVSKDSRLLYFELLADTDSEEDQMGCDHSYPNESHLGLMACKRYSFYIDEQGKVFHQSNKTIKDKIPFYIQFRRLII